MRANRHSCRSSSLEVTRRSQFSTEEAGLPPFSPDESRSPGGPQAEALSRDEEQVAHGLQLPGE